MQKCEECSTPFKWSQIFRSATTGIKYKKIHCRNCDKEHKVTNSSHRAATLFTILPTSIFMSLFISYASGPFLQNIILAFIMAIFIGVGLAAFLPFFLKYRPVS